MYIHDSYKQYCRRSVIITVLSMHACSPIETRTAKVFQVLWVLNLVLKALIINIIDVFCTPRNANAFGSRCHFSVLYSHKNETIYSIATRLYFVIRLEGWDELLVNLFDPVSTFFRGRPADNEAGLFVAFGDHVDVDMVNDLMSNWAVVL